jgi:tRNA threonylcarbamoyladenosine biosynthesis protein TsaE
MRLKIDLPEEKITNQVAAKLAKALSAPLVLGFSGDIGAGKTTFIRAMLRSMGAQGAIKSPTYSLVESYSVQNWQFNHFDLYRIQEDAELEYIGFRDYFTPQTICCIEWPERIQNGLVDCIDIQLTLTTEGLGRSLDLRAISPKGRCVVSLFTGAL